MAIADCEDKAADVLHRVRAIIEAAGTPSETTFLESLIQKAAERDNLKEELAGERQDWTALVELLAKRVEQVERGIGTQIGTRLASDLAGADNSYERFKFVADQSTDVFGSDDLPLIIDFQDDFYPHFVEQVTGISHAEGWGRWTDSDICRIVFKKPIFGKFQITIQCFASVPNENRSILCVVGGDTLAFKPSGVFGIYKFRFNAVFLSQTIEFFIPNAISPEVLHEGRVPEPRRLGLALKRLEINRAL